MKKAAIFLAIAMTTGLLYGCFTSPQAITFTTAAYSYITPGDDTIDLTTTFDTNAYISKVICGDADVLDAGGPALQSAYSQPDAEAASVFNLDTSKLEKFDGMLCDIYVVASDASTVEETEASVRVYVGEQVSVDATPVTGETCEDGTLCLIEEDTEEEAAEDSEDVEDAEAVEDADAESTTDATVEVTADVIAE